MAHAQLTTTSPQPRALPSAQAARMASLDNLRTLVIGVVILHHAGQAYGPTGGEWPVFNPTRAAILGSFFTVNAAFGMGLLFLIAGYLAPRAYARRGARRFLGDRLARLGLPLLALSLGVFLPIAYASRGHRKPFGPFLLGYLARPELGHMWFVSLLLLFLAGYAGWRQIAQRRQGPPTPRPGGEPQPARPTPTALAASATPGNLTILGFALGLAAATFTVRIWFPTDRWFQPVPFLRIEPAHLPQYLSFFVLGVMAAQRDWLRQLPTWRGMVWLAIGLTAAALVYTTNLLGPRMPFPMTVIPGGLSRDAVVSGLVEAFLAVGLSIGLLVLFRERVGHQGPLARELAAGSYLVYLIHLFPVIGLQTAMAGPPLPPLAKFAIVSLLSVPICFLLAAVLRRLPWVRRVV